METAPYSPKTEFTKLSECPSWVSPKDVQIAGFGKKGETVHVIEPGDSVEVGITVDRNDFPPVPLRSGLIEDLRFSARSCIAQAGSFIYFSEESKLSDEDIKKLENGERIVVKGNLENHGNNSMKFEAGDRVGRFFYANEKDKVTGDALVKLVEEGLVKGEKGKDFVIFDRPYGPYAVALRVSGSRVCIPQGNGTIRVTSRDDLYKLTKDVEFLPEEAAKCPFFLQVTKTAVDVPQNMIMVLSNVTPNKDVRHLPSHLIDAGSKWPIRLEIEGGETNWVLVELYKSPLIGVDRSGDVTHFNANVKA